MKRRCNACKETKDIEEFSKDNRKKMGRRYTCKICSCNYQKEHRKGSYVPRSRELTGKSSAEKRLIKLYGITQEEYLRLVYECNGKCEICGKELKVPYIDHNHNTGKVRGLLCPKCNFGIGQFNDNIDLLELAIKYLRKED